MDSKTDVIVLFTGSKVRIIHGADGACYKLNPNALINPVFPKGIPPHLWKLGKGKIETDVAKKASTLSKHWRVSRPLITAFLLGAIASALVVHYGIH